MGFSTREYVDELEKERRKIEVFQRELPLCLDLVIQVIERYRREMTDPTETRRRNEADKGAPLLEQFIPLRPLDADHPKEVEVEDNIDDHHDDRRDDDDDDDGGTSEKKSDWLKTAQLWNENPKDDDSVEVVSEKVGEQQQQQKTRRCWSPELHRRFVNALEQLGGCHATPKQIREIMKVEGLTNDEVKSHLQKYRLHTKRLHPGAKSISSCETQHPQVVFSIWMQPTGHPNLQAKNMSPAHHTTAKSAGSINRSNPLLQFEHHKQLEQKKSNRSPRGPLRSDQAENSDHSCGTVGSL